jgi:hypothetical protein
MAGAGERGGGKRIINGKQKARRKKPCLRSIRETKRIIMYRQKGKK